MHKKTQIHISCTCLNNDSALKDLAYATDTQGTLNTYREASFGQYFFADLATMSPGLYQVVNKSTWSLCTVMVVHTFF